MSTAYKKDKKANLPYIIYKYYIVDDFLWESSVC